MVKTEYRIKGAVDFTSQRTLTIAIVADLHEREPEQVIKILKECKPDVIAVPGDLLENSSVMCREPEEDEEENWLSRVVSRLIHSIDYFVEAPPQTVRKLNFCIKKQ